MNRMSPEFCFLQFVLEELLHQLGWNTIIIYDVQKARVRAKMFGFSVFTPVKNPPRGLYIISNNSDCFLNDKSWALICTRSYFINLVSKPIYCDVKNTSFRVDCVRLFRPILSAFLSKLQAWWFWKVTFSWTTYLTFSWTTYLWSCTFVLQCISADFRHHLCDQHYHSIWDGENLVQNRVHVFVSTVSSSIIIRHGDPYWPKAEIFFKLKPDWYLCWISVSNVIIYGVEKARFKIGCIQPYCRLCNSWDFWGTWALLSAREFVHCEKFLPQ